MALPGGLGSLFGNLRFAIPGAPQNTPLNTPAPDDGRSYYTGQILPSAYNQPGNVNNNTNPANGPMLGPSTNILGRYSGPVPLGANQSQLASVPNGAHYGYQVPSIPGMNYSPYAPDINGAPLSGYYNPPAATPPAPRMTPKPGEQAANAHLQPMMGQWGGGGWNVGSGAPASLQPMWLGSMTGGQSWGQAPGFNATAPHAGQTTSTWSQAPNQDPDSPTWVQGGR